MFAPPPGIFRPRVFLLPVAAVVLVALAIVVIRNQLASAPDAGQATRQGPPPAVVQTEPARTGAIRAVFTYAGAVQASDQVNLVPRTSGIIQTIPVEVGTAARQGDVLATLDPGTLPDQVLQGRASVDSAQAKLAQVVAGARAEDVAAAGAQVQQAQARLEGLLQARAEDVAVAAAALDAAQARLDLMERGGRAEAVAQAQAALAAAEAKLALLLRGATDDARVAAVSAVEASRAAVASAQAALANLSGTTVTDVQSAQSAVEASKAALIAAETAMTNASLQYQVELRSAQGAFDVAQLNLEKALDDVRRLERGPTAAEVAIQEAAIASAEAALSSAVARHTASQACANNASLCTSSSSSSGSSSSSSSSRTSSGVVLPPSAQQLLADKAAVDSAEAALASARTRLLQLQGGATAAEVNAAQTALEQAQTSYMTSQARLDLVKQEGIDQRRARLQSQLNAAREKLAADEARLAALLGGGLTAQRAAAENQLVAAEERLKSDQAKLDEINRGPRAEEIDQAAAAVRQAEQALQVAVTPFTEEEIRAQRAAVEQARLQAQKALQPASDYDIQQQREVLAQMEAQYQGRANPYTVNDLKVALSAVELAEAQLAVATTNLEQTVLRAPFDGVVGQRLLSIGAFASPQTPILTLVGRGLEVKITVEEARVGLVAPGQAVNFAVPAYPGVTFAGSVLRVSPSGDPRAHTFDVTIAPIEQDPRLLAGMYAQVDLIAAQVSDAVLVPREAVVRQATQDIVYVVGDGRAAARQVKVGLADDQHLQIVEGLDAGEQVVTVGQTTLRDGQAVQSPRSRGGTGR